MIPIWMHLLLSDMAVSRLIRKPCYRKVISYPFTVASDPIPRLSGEELKLMKPVSYLINTARAALVDMPALEDALQNGSIMGAAIDVFPKEPLTKEDAVVQLDNCTLTNHRGGDTLDSYERSPELLLEQLQEAVQTGHTKYMI